MRESYIYKDLQTAGIVAVLAFGISSQAFATTTFTVDPNAAFGAAGGPHPGPFQADLITGNSSTLVKLDTTGPFPVGTTANGAGWVNFSSFVDENSNNVLGSVSGLNNNWQLWAEYSYTIALDSGAYAKPNSSYIVTGLHADLWVDPSIASATAFIAATNGGAAASVVHGADSFKVATVDLIEGVANINSLGGTGFNSTTNFTLLDPQGSALFTAPVPFYTVQFQNFNNTSQGIFIASDHITINKASGGVDFLSPVPEPETYAMLLAGLGVMGFIARRRSNTINLI
ncbi:putative secreted protein with PEP-CTERM sorting signal [Nitrosospira sp. Nsp5]|uniref:PEP-CTERM protein-sorting domain-containing protein n=1 Tax=Nitrosospira multiformis TaxID=1231 RepID=A0ABY0TK30_9PROT|nr:MULTISPECIES: flocculation-associated PEP-CTERM protein PepA [Nitrosospira]PTR09188.1 putative secreted protein with PEP-CTERM sorting signal [Nitrosospira sp. Nsp5]SDQ72948.1 PEP-CTERM protein-sorting domain-containing protein [Nitrosospira multiformis]